MPEKRAHKIVISSGTGEAETVIIEMLHPTSTSIQEDVDDLFNVLVETLERRRFDALVDRILEYKRKGGYPIPEFHRKNARRRESHKRQTTLHFHEDTANSSG